MDAKFSHVCPFRFLWNIIGLPSHAADVSTCLARLLEEGNIGKDLLSERKSSIQSSTPPCWLCTSSLRNHSCRLEDPYLILGASGGESAKCLFIFIPPHQLSRWLPASSYLPTVVLTRHLRSKQMQHILRHQLLGSLSN
jgi:hypothetical protein